MSDLYLDHLAMAIPRALEAAQNHVRVAPEDAAKEVAEALDAAKELVRWLEARDNEKPS